MKKQLLMGTLALGAVMPVAMAPVSPAQAIGLTCSPAITEKINPNLGCQLGSTNNDFVNGGNANFANFQVNKDNIFGYNSWLLAGKDEPGGTLNISPEFPGNATSGTFNVSSFVQSNWSDVMLVFKGGGGNITPDAYVAYLLRENFAGGLSGTWNTPFANARNGNAADVSHISLYYREGEQTEIPTPALLPAVLGMSAAMFRKKKQEDKMQEASENA